jgi:hypothetical protein
VRIADGGRIVAIGDHTRAVAVTATETGARLAGLQAVAVGLARNTVRAVAGLTDPVAAARSRSQTAGTVARTGTTILAQLADAVPVATATRALTRLETVARRVALQYPTAATVGSAALTAEVRAITDLARVDDAVAAGGSNFLAESV